MFPLTSYSRDEVKAKWSVSDFIKAFIKFHGHVYLCKSLDKLNTLREKLEEQFQVQPKTLAVEHITDDSKQNTVLTETLLTDHLSTSSSDVLFINCPTETDSPESLQLPAAGAHHGDKPL